MQKTLIAYYSFSGSTQALAQTLWRCAGGDLRALIPEKPYAFDNNTASKQARQQIARGYCPPLRAGQAPIDAYEIVFVGSPNWFATMAPPLYAFLHAHDFSRKTVIPFCTHGGGGFGRMEADVRAACPGASVLPGLAVAGEAEAGMVEAFWASLAL